MEQSALKGALCLLCLQAAIDFLGFCLDIGWQLN